LRLRVPCAERLKNRSGRLDFQRGILAADANGQLTVRTTGAQGSHILSSMSRANCYIVLPPTPTEYAAGSLVEVEPFAGLT
jgi:molybdopterin molybdotransferase